MTDFDTLLVGGGLANGLTALAMLDARPDARIALVERAPAAAGNHTWCFHSGDLAEEHRRFVEPLVVHRWDGYAVRFPSHERELDEPYAAVTSERLAAVLKQRLGSNLLLGRAAIEVAPEHVVLDDGTRLRAPLVVDARGPSRFRAEGSVAWQKFVGLELELASASPITRPILMDARVPQLDGFRFVYVLPLSETRVLVEDTYFSDGPELDVGALRTRILAYALERGLAVASVGREERGVLPLPSRAFSPEIARPFNAGYGGGWFHPTTGYSFPVAVRVARLLATTPLGDPSWRRFAAEHARQARFACFLNRLLFAACKPEDRVFVLERFYRLPAASVRRFYALSTTGGDRARIVCGRPPRGVSIGAALTRGVLS